MPMLQDLFAFSSLLQGIKISFNTFAFGNNLVIQSIYRSYSTHIPRNIRQLKPVKVTTSSNSSRKRTNEAQMKEKTNFADESYDTDELAYRISKYSSKNQAYAANKESVRNWVKERAFLRAKTIERIYFKKPEVPNLLTWAAKEQLRFLHEKDPKEWTVEKLAESFPVNEECIKKILRSRIRLHREEDIIQHDLQVQKNWIDLKNALENGDSTVFDEKFYEKLKIFHNKNIIGNASGIMHLPYPQKKKKSNAAVGPFSSIVEDCYLNKEVNHMDSLKLQDKVARLSSVLSDIGNTLSRKSNDENSFPKNTEEPNSDVSQNKTFSKFNYKKATITNYQHQYQPGSISSLPKKSLKTEDIDKTRRKRYLSGNSVYDENGEFLFRIP